MWWQSTLKSFGFSIAVFALSVLMILTVENAAAQWWNPFEPKDYEDCADAAARQAASDRALSILLSNCRAKFRGRRESGGGYSIVVYDRDFIGKCRIAGPDPTGKELKSCKARVSEKAAAARERGARVKLQLQTRDAQIFCEDKWCTTLMGTVSVDNGAEEEIDGFEIGWAIFPPDTKAKCPTTFSERKSFYSPVQPGTAATVTFETRYMNFEEGVRYCVRVSRVRLGGYWY